MATTCGPVYEVGAKYTEQLNYSNPLGRPVQPIWFEEERFFMLNTDYEVFWTDPPVVLPKEYVFRYGTQAAPGGYVPGQLPIYSLIPGSYHYQPLVEVVEVYVPSTYIANSLRSAHAVLTSDYPINETGTYFVRPVL